MTCVPINCKLYCKILQTRMNIEMYIQSIVLKKIFETIFFDRRRGVESKRNTEESLKSSEMEVIEIFEVHEGPIRPLRMCVPRKIGLKFLKKPNPISEGVVTIDKPIVHINKEFN
ncbi:hypothetical protein CWI39_1858p0010 [Hamiltosporidium magnivora]|uniref:Uncharacterized protein n=1 Tax=Hamiltosporidium magnivora TaxID=148818 RepID=A0A4Q9L060_9MICR|nr:hypothetical protein CWI39_1858p0010 [Hamiltosporidium magnivora]